MATSIIRGMKTHNPFVIHGYEGPEFFCDRAEETRKLRSAAENGRNVTLLAERRIGKTGLVRHFFESLRKEREWRTVYLDIFATSSLAEFTKQFASAVIGSMDSRLDKAVVAASKFFKSLKPELSVDSMTGAPLVSFGLAPKSVESTLKECFDYLGSRGNCVVAIDEFQQIAAYPESGTEALLRSYVQFLPDARFVFAGSRHHLMTEMFASSKRPFFNSTQTLPLDRIPRDAYFDFAQSRMSRSCKLEAGAFDLLYSLFDGITWYVQTVLNRLFERGSATEADVRATVEELLQEKTWEFSALFKSLPAGSRRLLKAVAAEGVARTVTGAAFLSAHSLGGSASVHLALRRLLENELLYDTGDGYVVYDRLFGFWLARLPR